MNNINHQLAVQNAVKDRFKGKKRIVSKTAPLYPSSAEREMVRIAAAYMREYNSELKKYLPELMKAYRENEVIRKDSTDFRTDDTREFNKKLEEVMRRINESMTGRLSKFRLQTRVKKAAELLKSTSTREWKRVVRDTLGINLLDDYYKGEFYEQAIASWVTDNVSKIKSIPEQSLSEIHSIVNDGYLQGRTAKDIAKDIQAEYDLSKGMAQMMARDQIGTLNAQITQQQQRDAGCTCYEWSDSGDGRVRDCHKALHGKIIDWNNPPEMWYMTKSRGKVMTGRKCHPGEDYQCRCCALPVFNFETVDVPFSSDKG